MSKQTNKKRKKKWQGRVLLPALVCCTPAWASPPAFVFDTLISPPTSVEAKAKPAFASVSIQEVSDKLARLQAQSGTDGDLEGLDFATFETLESLPSATQPISRIDGGQPPVGLPAVLAYEDMAYLAQSPQAVLETDSVQGVRLVEGVLIVDNEGVDPNQYLPAHQPAPATPPIVSPETVADKLEKRPNVLQRAYGYFFNDGVFAVPRLSVNVYLNDKSVTPNLDTAEQTPKDGGVLVSIDDDWAYQVTTLPAQAAVPNTAKYQPANTKIEPFRNVKAALEDIAVESVPSFSSALPRLREVVSQALQAVGYYDSEFRLVNAGNGNIDVIIDRLGEPVMVMSHIFDVRGEGEGLPVFESIADKMAEQVEQPLNHQKYEAIKTDVQQAAMDHGFFEGQWLERSLDVLLPDNVADLSLVYETGTQYVFDDVVFFTIDPETGDFTTDPAKLPVKLPLLQKLVSFSPQASFDRHKVNQLSADLTATRYFNTVNVEAVLPGFDDEAKGVNDGSPKTGTPPNNKGEHGEASEQIVLDESSNVVAEIVAIDFSPSQGLMDKLALVTAKADRLYNSPSDRVLGENKKQSTSLLGQLSDAIGGVFKAILPDESEDELPMQNPTATLAGRKTPGDVASDKKVPLYVFVMADKPKDAQIGLGWGSDTGERLTAKFDNNLVNNKGYQAGVQLSASRLDRAISGYVSRPLTHPINDKLSATLKYQEEETVQSANASLSVRTLETGLTRTQIYSDGWNKSYFVRYRLDELEGSGTADEMPVQFNAAGVDQEAALIGLSFSRSTQDSLTAPTQGHRQYYSLEVGSRKLRSDTNMVIAKAGLGGVMSFGDNAYGKARAHQIVGRLDAGYLWADDFRRVPYKLRFFAGGDGSIRGYSHHSLSPVNQAGYLMGGQVLAVGSIEYNYEFMNGFRAAVFGDFGGAYDAKFRNETKLGVGAGLRWASPVGTVRADIAKGVEKERTPIRLHFLIGLPF